MKLQLDAAADAAYLRLLETDVVESEEVAPGVVLDFDAEGAVVGVEVVGLKARGLALTEVEVVGS